MFHGTRPKSRCRSAPSAASNFRNNEFQRLEDKKKRSSQNTGIVRSGKGRTTINVDLTAKGVAVWSGGRRDDYGNNAVVECDGRNISHDYHDDDDNDNEPKDATKGLLPYYLGGKFKRGELKRRSLDSCASSKAQEDGRKSPNGAENPLVPRVIKGSPSTVRRRPDSLSTIQRDFSSSASSRRRRVSRFASHQTSRRDPFERFARTPARTRRDNDDLANLRPATADSRFPSMRDSISDSTKELRSSFKRPSTEGGRCSSAKSVSFQDALTSRSRCSSLTDLAVQTDFEDHDDVEEEVGAEGDEEEEEETNRGQKETTGIDEKSVKDKSEILDTRSHGQRSFNQPLVSNKNLEGAARVSTSVETPASCVIPTITAVPSISPAKESLIDHTRVNSATTDKTFGGVSSNTIPAISSSLKIADTSADDMEGLNTVSWTENLTSHQVISWVTNNIDKKSQTYENGKLLFSYHCC